MSLPPDRSPDFDAAQDEGPLRYQSINDLIIDPQHLGSETQVERSAQQLLTVIAEEPSTFADVERDPCWRKAMAEEMRSIEENRT